MVETGAITSAQRAKALAAQQPKVWQRARRTRPRSTSSTGWTARTRQLGPPKQDLVVETTLDRRASRRPRRRPQRHATLARYARAGIEQAALVALDGQGRVRAMVGGADYAGQPAINRAVDAHRQAGSSWKPFVYLDRAGGGADARHARGRPAGDHRRLVAAATSSRATSARSRCRQALAQSINTVAASVADQVGRPNVAATAQGSASPRRSTPTRPWRWARPWSTPLEMAQAYDAFANGGDRVARLRLRAHPHRRRGEAALAAPRPARRRRRSAIRRSAS